MSYHSLSNLSKVKSYLSVCSLNIVQQKTLFQGDMTEDLGDLLVEDGEEMFEALSQMPVISISCLDSDLKSNFPGLRKLHIC